VKGSDGKAAPSYSHSLDAGAAWAILALQAARSGWHTHGMSGIELAKAASDSEMPETHRIEAVPTA